VGSAESNEGGLLEQVLTAVGTGLVVLSVDGTVTLANDAARDLLGLLEGDRSLPAQGTAILDSLGTPLGSDDLPWSRTAMDGQERRGRVLRMRAGSGELTDIVTDAVPLTAEDGAVIGVAAGIRSVRGEAAGRIDAAARLEALLEQLPIGIVLVDRSGAVRYRNESVDRVWGRPYTATALSQLSDDFPARHPDGRTYRIDERPLVRALAGETVRDEELHVQRADGTTVVVVSSAAPVRDADGNVVAAIGALLDVTDRALAEKLNAAMGEIASAMDSGLDPGDVMKRVLETATSAVGAGGAVVLGREDDGWLITFEHGYGDSVLRTSFTSAEASVAIQAFDSGRAVGLTSVADEFATAWAGAGRVRSVLAVPIDVRGEPAGVLIFAFPSSTVFTGTHIAFTERLARAVSLALGNTALVESLRSELAHTKLLQEVAVVAASSPELRVVCSRILKALKRHLGMLAGGICVLSAEGTRLHVVASTGIADDLVERMCGEPIAGSDRLTQSLLREQRAMSHEDASAWPELAESVAQAGFASHRYVLVPIDFRKRTVGALMMAFEHLRPFTDDEMQLFHAVAHTLGQAVETARLLEAEKEARQQAMSELEISSMLLETAEALAHPLELDQVCEALADSALRVTGRSRVIIALLHPRGGELVVRAVRGTPHVRIGDSVPLDDFGADFRGMLERGHALALRLDALGLPDGPRRRAESLGAISGLLVPIMHGGRPVGVMTVDEPGEPTVFGEREKRLCENVASLAAVVIENARTYESEHRIAETLQETLLLMPESVPGVTFGTLYRSATAAARVGGDFYDVYEVGSGHVALVVGDVSGKGLDAASVTSLARDTLRIHASEGLSPGRVMEKANEVLRRFTSADTFVTAFFGVLETATGAFTYVCAGHPDGMIVGGGGYVRTLGGESPLLGALEDVTFPERVTILAPADTLFLYTDGVTEARRGRDFYGVERLAAFLATVNDNDPRELPVTVFREVEAFAGGQLRDDIAMLAVRREAGPTGER
jgi:PAS domain S-box-containing protein